MLQAATLDERDHHLIAAVAAPVSQGRREIALGEPASLRSSSQRLVDLLLAVDRSELDGLVIFILARAVPAPAVNQRGLLPDRARGRRLPASGEFDQDLAGDV